MNEHIKPSEPRQPIHESGVALDMGGMSAEQQQETSETHQRAFMPRRLLGAIRRVTEYVRSRRSHTEPSDYVERPQPGNYFEVDLSHLPPAVLGDVPQGEYVDPNSVSAVMDDLLSAENLQRTRGELLEKEQTGQDSSERAIARSHYGFMESRPDSLIVRSSSEEAKRILEAASRCPKFEHQKFMSKEELVRSADTSKAIVIERLEDDPNLVLPLKNFVYAEGFLSWQRGRGGIKKVEDSAAAIVRTSYNTLHEYATRTTKAPPIESVIGYVQPDGQVLYATERGSHRTGAAVARGDATIEAKKLTLITLKENILQKYGN